MSKTVDIPVLPAAYWKQSGLPIPAEEEAYHRNMRVLYQHALQKKDRIINDRFIQRGRNPALFQEWYTEVAMGIALLSEEYEDMDDVDDDGKDGRFLTKIARYWRKYLTIADCRDYDEVWRFVVGTEFHWE
ncbi:MAG: hypothetical protein LQ351_001849 [Letrouitia transgressa]|nr:MAG: hypothetical protein LQ351_001849 [Letrouitia transgressa]